MSPKAAMYFPGDQPFSTSAQGTVENTRLVQSANASDESEGSEPESDSDDEPIATKLRAEKVPMGIRQGNGDSAELGPGVFSPTMPKLTSIKTRQPSDCKYGDRHCIVMFRDEHTGEQYFHTAIADVAEKPTKKRRQGTAVKGNQPYRSEPYGKDAAPYRRDHSKLPAFVPIDAHGFGGPRTKPQDADFGDT